jgi:hypothetical protein
MDGIGAASSVIAVVELSSKVVSLCSQYYRAVKKAKQDIMRLQGVVENLSIIFKDVYDMLDGQQGSKLQSSQKIKQVVVECTSELEWLENKLELHVGQKTMRRFGIRALKWPLTNMEVDKVIQILRRSEDDIALAMQIDQS